MQAEILEFLRGILELAFFAAISGAALYVRTWLKAQKQEIAEKVKDNMTKKYLDILEKTISDCVLATNQTYVNALKKDGVFDLEAQKRAFQLTHDAVLASLSSSAKAHLGDVVEDLETYVTNKIEAHVSMAKDKKQ